MVLDQIKDVGDIRKLNEELKQKGFITIAGKIPKKYLEERCYGLAEKDA